jgi:hypothetical protein
MFKGFNFKGFNPNGRFIESYRAQGESITAADQRAVRGTLARIVNSVATLDGTQIQNSWFPQVTADVFISHSHRNVDAAMALAGWLKRTFDLTAFVDSSVWGYAAELLKIIDKEYCLNPGGETYDYDKRNESTSHVYMMLSTALGMMIDKTECLLFLNTPDSISSTDVVVSKTKSPWIYSELMTAGIVEERPPERHRMIKLAASLNEGARQESLSIEYSVAKLSRLKDISTATLNAWANERRLSDNEHALDVFYRVVACN